MSLEKERIKEIIYKGDFWQEWGPYLPEREWGTVRECFSSPEQAWKYTTFDTARVRNYLLGEDGIFGWCERSGRLCFSMSFWNGVDSILKERFFGLSALEGNHGEDVKEYYYYLDAVPSFSYAKALYRYPCEAFPYDKLISGNQSRSCYDPEYELLDTGVFDNLNYFDIFVEYAKGSPKDIAIQITAWNRSKETKPLHIIPQFFFRNSWQWSWLLDRIDRKPQIYYGGANHVVFSDSKLGEYRLECGEGTGNVLPQLLFCENESEFDSQSENGIFSKRQREAFTQRIIYNNSEFLSLNNRGTRVAVWYVFSVPAHSSVSVQLRFSSISEMSSEPTGEKCTHLLELRRKECDAFYDEILPKKIDNSEKTIMRQAYAGLLWTRIFYSLPIKDWLHVANQLGYHEKHRRFEPWRQLCVSDVLSVPDKWEYPWFASWDLPFHLIPTARIDPAFCIKQFQLFLSERYQNTTGQIPASEWNFSFVNPPVMAWGINKVMTLLERLHFSANIDDLYNTFLLDALCGLYSNLIWWTNLKDTDGKTLFENGFIGLDNFCLLEKIPEQEHTIEESQAVFWTPFLIGNILELACNVAIKYPLFEKIAVRLCHYFIKSIDLLQGNNGLTFWDENDSFFYPLLRVEGKEFQLPVRAFSGLVPLFGIVHLPLHSLPELSKVVEGLLNTHKYLSAFSKTFCCKDTGNTYIAISCITDQQRDALLKYALDESEFLSPYGLRSLSRYHREKPLYVHTSRRHYEIKYCPGELESRIFGGNTNWFGPIWFPLNYLFIHSMDKLGLSHSEFKYTSSQQFENYSFHNIADELRSRLLTLFKKNSQGCIPSMETFYRYNNIFSCEEHLLFYEYFNGDTGEGIGASHQTGWTALIAEIIQELANQ
ncbi:MAG TPA: glucosidase [Candidatus Hydrogenedens sp.]|nr:glucosidase [Candidatus Hydrogenedens sp.]